MSEAAANVVTIAITTGEPAGVGPELTLAALAKGIAEGRWSTGVHFVVLGDARLLAERAVAVGVDLPALTAVVKTTVSSVPDGAGGTGRDEADEVSTVVTCVDTSLAVPCAAGHLDARNGPYVLALLDVAIDGALAGRFDAIVTAPLQKSTINDAGVPFTGHTEYLAERTHTAQVVMMLAGTGEHPLRVALATTHLPLSEVPGALSIDGLVRILAIIEGDLRRDFGIAEPRILVTGLNPHAGENGYLGREEIDVISPALERAKAIGIDARGPYPADTLFQPRYLADADCVLAMFHDQGLPVLKYATFGEGINITLGLPIIRTSVDHGTALDLAGTGRADDGSMLAAIDTAVRLARNRAAASGRALV
jgi:4-hydroxythreonine-4-phosphate dehydrogenase